MITAEINSILDNLEDLIADIDGQNILITGGAGFLGSWLSAALLEMGAKVLCLNRGWPKPNIANLISNDNFTFIKHDMTDPIKLKHSVDVVLQLASRSLPPDFTRIPLQILKANTFGVLNALEVAKEHEARFLYTSAAAVYGNAIEIPTSEAYTGNVNTTGVDSCYAESKRCGESFVHAYQVEHDIDARIARLFNTHGPQIRTDGKYAFGAVPHFVEQALAGEPIIIFGDGSQTRSFCYVTDVITALLKLAFVDNLSGEVINIGNDEELSINGYADLVNQLSNMNTPIEHRVDPAGESARRLPDITKARTLLKWKPKVNSESAILKFIEWFKQ